MATNTTKTVFKDSRATDAELAAKAMKENRELVKEKRVKFKCEPVYHSLYPNGFDSMCQGIHVLLIFDGREVELPEFIVEFVKRKLDKKVMSTFDKKTRNTTKKQDYLGMEYVS